MIIGDNQSDLDNKLEKISEATSIPKDIYLKKPLVGVKNEVFEKIDEFETHGCVYLIAYIADIVWGDTLDILKDKL